MTTLNSQLQLALLNQKKKRNLLEKGFTLVELMIVIVIVGILSAVALPNFLAQTDKAKGTEAKSQIASAIKRAHADSQETAITGYAAADVGLNDTKYFTYQCSFTELTAANCTATGTADAGNLSTKTVIGTIDLTTNDNMTWSGTASI